MWPRLQFDISWTDLLAGAAYCCGGGAESRKAACERAWDDSGNSIICSSLRSGFDLLLTACRFPPDSEVLCSALTVPDVARIIRGHDLVPVPVDLIPNGFAPSLDSAERLVNDNTRMLVVAHLFGDRVDLRPWVEFARRHELLLVEDAAQCFGGKAWQAEPGVDASLLSFGPIKTATALGGGILQVKSPALRNAARRTQADFPRQSRLAFAQRILKFAVLKSFAGPRGFRCLMTPARWLRADLDRLLGNIARNYPSGDLLQRIRQQPSAPLLSLLHRRLTGYDAARITRRVELGRYLFERIGEGRERLTPTNGCWVFPVLTEDSSLVDDLRLAGFDATAECRLDVIPPPPEHPAAAEALATYERLVFLPLYPDLPRREVERLAELVVGRVVLPSWSDARPLVAAR